MSTVKDLLSRKGNRIVSFHANATVYDALGAMAERDIGALLVTEGEALCGIFFERDYVRKVVLGGRNERHMSVSDVMVTELISVTPEDSVKKCMQIMTGYHVRHLPVFEDEKLIGVVTISDVVKDVIEEQKTTISQLEQYICGGYLS